MTNVRCNVSSCEFWGEGNVCEADEIWVKSNMLNDADDELGTIDVEFGEEQEGFQEEEREKKEQTAETSSQTCCETMRPRSRRSVQRQEGAKI